MNRLLLGMVSLVAMSTCAPTLKSVDRSLWVLVHGDDGQILIPLDDYEKELVGGRERKVKLALDEKGPVLHEVTSPLSMKVGEVLRFRLNEGSNVDLQSDEAVATAYWTESYRVDGWKGDQAIEIKESMVYLRGRKAGTGKLKLIDQTWGTHEYDVVVVDPSAPAKEPAKSKPAKAPAAAPAASPSSADAGR